MNYRIEAALAALPKATPGTWALGDPGVVAPFCICAESVGNGYYSVMGKAYDRGPHPLYGGGISPETAEANALLFVAAPDLAAEVIRLRAAETALLARMREKIEAERDFAIAVKGDTPEYLQGIHDALRAVDEVEKEGGR